MISCMAVRFAQASSLDFLSRLTILFLSGADRHGQRCGGYSAESCDCGHEMGILFKKELAIAENKPKLTVLPRPDPGSGGQTASGSHSTPETDCPPLNF